MQYTKPHLSFEDQADRLIQRGLIVRDKQQLIQILKQVSYYRLSAYWYPFREKDEQGKIKDNLCTEITLERVWDHYRFDRRLRVLFVDAIERIEIALRTQLVYLYTEKHSPFDYVKPSSFPTWKYCEDKIKRLKSRRESRMDPVQKDADMSASSISLKNMGIHISTFRYGCFPK